jgi:two-component system chemotaxis response regulator CheY
MRVMIVDDSRTARLMLRKMLPPALLTDLVEVSGGREAVTRCETEQVDLMFLDLTMPDLDGYGVLMSLKLRDLMPPTIVVSADSQQKARERVLALGARAFVKKTPPRGELERVLRDAGLL